MDEPDPRTIPGYAPPRQRGPLGWFRRFGEALEDLDRGLQRWLTQRRWQRHEKVRRQVQRLQQQNDRRD
jgi:hypothetical protein